MKLLLVAATQAEIPARLEHPAHRIEQLITGVGMTATAYQLGKKLQHDSYDLVINIGIAGSLNPDLPIGETVNIISEQFADLGAEDARGEFLDVFFLGLIDPDKHPFQSGIMHNPDRKIARFLPAAKGITVQKVHGQQDSIDQLQTRVQADVESMEGAAVFYVCLSENVPFLEIRAISNRVEARDRESWNIPAALRALHSSLFQLLEQLA